jgi:hypothetical protein
MAKTLSITLTSKGADAGPFDIIAYNGNTVLSTVVSNATLVVNTPVQYTNVPEAATSVRLLSKGLCTNFIDLTIQ